MHHTNADISQHALGKLSPQQLERCSTAFNGLAEDFGKSWIENFFQGGQSLPFVLYLSWLWDHWCVVRGLPGAEELKQRWQTGIKNHGVLEEVRVISEIIQKGGIVELGACPSNVHFGLDSQRALWFLGGMAKTFKSWDVDQPVLLPPSVQELVPAGHLAHFVRDLVRESLDVSAILTPYTEDRGFPPYDPTMMTALLLYAYSQGLYASRRIAKACEERVDFMAVTARQQPDFRTISDFRKRHLPALGGLFTQVLRLCQQAGLVSLGHVALDGTKIRANASKHKAMSYSRMKTGEPALAAEVAQWLATAAASDACEDASYGVNRRGDELPEWVTNKQHRLEKIRAAKAALEAEAAALVRKEEAPLDRPRRGRPAKNPPGMPRDRVQRNFTDPDSRIMKARDGFIQGYHAQAAVDADHQVIVAQGLTNQASDAHQLEPMLAHIKTNTGRQARELSADAGYCSEHNLTTLTRHHVRGYVATGRQQHGMASATGARTTVPRTRVHAMKIRLTRAGYRSRYRLRKQVVEPVFGQIKQARGLRQFLLRGLPQVAGEWSLLCSVHNMLKLAGARG